MSNFVHLHVHTEYSLLDGACVIKRLVEKVKNQGEKAVAITDHGVMYGVIDFYKECKKNGIKPIIGCEVYVANRTRFDKVHKMDFSSHLVLLCKNNQGYQNLIKMVSLAHTEGFYNKPRVDKELLSKYNDGLICLSACLAGEIPKELLSGDYEKAKKTAIFYRDTFGKENYYIELQNHDILQQKQILPQLKRLADDIGVGVVATNDAHYINKEDSKTQNVLTCIQTNSLVGNAALEFPTKEFYIKSADEMSELFKDYDGAIKNTLKIADMCNVEFEFGVTKLPYYQAPNGENNISYFKRLCYDGLKKYYGEDINAKQRMDYELQIIEQMGYIDYFLIVLDFIQYAKQNDIPVGPGRGSGAGSICAYCVGITGIDPLKYNLLFERFLNPERISMPDFDIDFCFEKRQQVIDYVVKKYGNDHVAQIITFGTMAAKGAIRDVARVLGMPYQSADTIAKLIPNEIGMTIDKALSVSKDLKTIYDNDVLSKEVIDLAKKLEGMPRNSSTHAAGVVITRNEINSYVPLSKNDESIVTQYTMTALEELGLLKMDFLGLRTLTVIDNCVKMIGNIKIDNIDISDKEVYKMLGNGDAQGVFQFESAGMKRVLTQLKPENIEDLTAVISLYRPGPMDSIPKYIKNKHNPKQIKYKHPLLKPILDVTYGCIVYQEQVMQICRQLAGYSYGRADLVRRAMAKKKADVMEKEREIFMYGNDEVCGALKNGVSKEIADSIFDEMISFASYAFNKSHAAAYATVAYQTAYLKCHYKTEFMASLLTSVLGNTDKIIEYVEYCKATGITVLPPDINLSNSGFIVENNNIRFGILAIKNVGKSSIEGIIKERQLNGKYTDIINFIKRTNSFDLNKRAIESLIKCGAFDSFSNNRRELICSYEGIVDSVYSNERKNIEGQIDFFFNNNQKNEEYIIKEMEDFSPLQKLSMEKEITGIYISGHPLDNYFFSSATNILDVLNLEDFEDDSDVTILCIVQSIKTLVTKSKNVMAFLKAEDKTGVIEVIVFAKDYEPNRKIFEEGSIILINGKVSVKEDEPPKIILKKYETPSVNTIKNTLYIRFKSSQELNVNKVLSEISNNNQGNNVCRVILYFEDTKKQLKLKNDNIIFNQQLYNIIKSIVGDENIALR